MKGLPDISTRAFGIDSVSGRSRVAKPPESIAAISTIINTDSL